MTLQAELFSYRLPYRQTVTWSDVREDGADYVLLKLTDDAGRIGLAEATVKPTWSGHTVGSMLATLREVLLPLLATPEPRRRLRQVAEQPQARGLVESALALLALQDAPARRVPVSCTLTRESPERMAAAAEAWHLGFGIRRFKLKGGQGMTLDAQAVAAVRAATPRAAVQVDANSAYAHGELARYAGALADAGAVLLEDPCPLPLAGFIALAHHCALPLLVDLAARDADSAAAFAAQGARAISVKPGRYGAFEAAAVAGAARANGAQVTLGLFGESDLGAALNLHLAAACTTGADSLPAELTGHLMLGERLLLGGLEPRDGCIELPALHELLERIDWTRMTRHAH